MYTLELINVDEIKETELHIPERVLWLTNKIKIEKVWRVPVLLDKKTLAIMDGHHRFNVAKRLGLRRIPAILLSYDSPNVIVSSWRKDVYIDKDVIRQYIIDGKLFPHKTTKHIIQPQPKEIEIPISFLF